MTDPNLGLVGLGGLGKRHLQALQRIGGVNIAAIADIDEATVAEQSRQWGVVGFQDWRELLDRAEIDALMVVTPPGTHAEIAIAALERGIDVFIEKPLARSQADADSIVEAVARTGRVCAVGYQWRALSFLDQVRDAVVGQEISLVVGRSIGPTRARPWFVNLAEGGGILLELVTHDIDLHRAILGNVVAVQAAISDVPLAQQRNDPNRIPNAMTLTLHFESGALSTANTAWTSHGTPALYSLDVLATETTLSLQLDPVFALSGFSRGRTVEARADRSPSDRNIAGFLAAVRNSNPAAVYSRPHDAAAALAVALAANEALASGCKVAVKRDG